MNAQMPGPEFNSKLLIGKAGTQTSMHSSFVPRVFGSVLQRKCACGQNTGGGECEDCKKKHDVLQRHPSGNSEAASVPPIVHEVLSSPGQPLDAATRAFM